MKNKKGFTLVEILGVIVILSLLLLIAFPQIMGQLKTATKEIDEATKNLIFDSAKIYINKNVSEYPLTDTNVYCITLQTLVDSGYLIEDLTKIGTGKKVDLTNVVKAKIENDANVDYDIVNADQCVEFRYTP